MNKIIISRNQWFKLKDQTRDTALAIITTCGSIIKQAENDHYMNTIFTAMCSGLYTHSVEEYGKFIFLQGHLPINEKVEIDYDEFKNHKLKFKLALKNMPSTCKILHDSDYDSKNYNSDYNIEDIIPEWSTRLQIFNTDIDPDGNVKPYPKIEFGKLKQAVNDFQILLWKINPVSEFRDIFL